MLPPPRRLLRRWRCCTRGRLLRGTSCSGGPRSCQLRAGQSRRSQAAAPACKGVGGSPEGAAANGLLSSVGQIVVCALHRARLPGPVKQGPHVPWRPLGGSFHHLRKAQDLACAERAWACRTRWHTQPCRACLAALLTARVVLIALVAVLVVLVIALEIGQAPDAAGGRALPSRSSCARCSVHNRPLSVLGPCAACREAASWS